jgi:hypothetical protein
MAGSVYYPIYSMLDRDWISDCVLLFQVRRQFWRRADQRD